MKLLLTSNGFIGNSLENDFLEMVGNRTNLKVAIIPTASDPIEWVPLVEGDTSYDNFIPKLVGESSGGRGEYYEYFTNKGYGVKVVDLKENPKDVKEKLQSVDIIFVGGGDVNYLLEWAKKAEMGNYLKNLLDNNVIYIGVSAGVGLIIPDIGLTWWEPNMKADHAGFGIVDFVTVPHQKESNKEKSAEKLTERKKYLNEAAGFPWKVYLLKDGQAIKVVDDNVEHIGEGIKKSI